MTVTLSMKMLANVPSDTVGKAPDHYFALGDVNVIGYNDSVRNIDGDAVVDRDDDACWRHS